MLRRIAVVVTLGACALSVQTASGRSLTSNTIDATARVSDDGRSLGVGGPIGCSKVHALKVVVRVTQRDTAAFGVGTFKGLCHMGARGRWSATVRATGRERFEPGEAEVVALAITRKHGKRTDAHQWLKLTELVGG